MERLLDYFIPEKYILDLEIDKLKKRIGGRVTVTGEAASETVKFHAVGLSVSEVAINGKKHEFKVEDGVLTVLGAPRGKVEVEVGYEGALNENMQGAYLSTYEYQGKTEVLVATQFESHYAREAFPCIDEPAAKAVFELSISLPEGSEDVVLSNMPELTTGDSRPSSLAPVVTGLASSIAPVVANGLESPVADSGPETTSRPTHTGLTSSIAPESPVADSGLRTVSFQPTPRMSTYLLAWVIGRFHGKTVRNKHGVEITTYCSLAQELDAVDYANEIAARSLEFYDDNFGVAYPLKKLDQVALPDFEAGAMENWGLVTYRESMMLVPKTATIETKKSVALTVAHELSHQWFGDLVTMQWWDDLWLNESFASIMEYYAVDKIHPEYQIFEIFLTRDAYAALVRDGFYDVQSVHQEVKTPEEIATLFDSAIVYSKGAHLMLMLIRAMGFEKFCRGCQDYFEKYQYQNTVGDDLWRALEPYADFGVAEMMHAFIERPGYPVIESKNGSFQVFSQRRFLFDREMEPAGSSDWPVPELTEDMSGHYVLNLTDEEFAERMENFSRLGLEEKLRLLIDRALVSKTELASMADLVPLVMKFRDEDSAAVWSIIAAIIGNLKACFKFESAEEKELKKFVGKLIAKKMAEVGVEKQAGESENTLRLRGTLIGLAFLAEEKEVLQALAEKYSDDYASLEPERRGDILEAKVYFEPEMVEKYMTEYAKNADPEIKFDLLFAGTRAREKKALEKMMTYLEKTKIVKPQDQLYLFIFLYRNPRTKMEVFAWLEEHWEFVREMMGDKSLDAYPRQIAHTMKEEAELEKYQAFFGPMKKESGLARAIEIGENEIKSSIKLIAKDGKKVQEAVKKEI